MAGFGGSDSGIVGGTGWDTIPTNGPVTTDPKKQYLPVGPQWVTPAALLSIPRYADEVTRQVGPRAYEAMLTDPAVQSSYLGLKLAILDGGMQLSPTVKPDPAKQAQAKAKSKAAKRSTPDDKPAGNGDAGGVATPDATPEPVLSPEEALAQEVCDFCQWATDRLCDWKAVLLQLLDAMAFGVKLAEPTMEVMDEGDYAGKLCWASIKVKPGWAWQFVVDAYLDVKGILTFLPYGGGQYIVITPDKAAWLTWLPRNSDPRGTSMLRAAYAAWNLKVQSLPLCYQHLVRWGSPGIDFEMAEGDTAPRIPTDANGVPLPGATLLDPVAYHTANLVQYRNGAVFVHPAGSNVGVIEPKSPGEAFWLAFDWLDRQICLAIELQTRNTLEAKNGSKADSETAQDKRGPVITYGRETLANAIRHGLYWQLVAVNYGKAVADTYTPLVSFGKTEHQDRPTLWTAIASLQSSGYLGESQKAGLDAEAGLPVRDAEADAAAAAEKAKLAPQITPFGAKPQPADGKPMPPGAKPAPPNGGKP